MLIHVGMPNSLKSFTPTSAARKASGQSDRNTGSQVLIVKRWALLRGCAILSLSAKAAAKLSPDRSG
jgi:hypothetical protein